MSRFLAFFGYRFYPEGGADDYLGEYESLDAAVQALVEKEGAESEGSGRPAWDYHWGQVWDSEAREVAWRTKPVGTL